MFKHDFTGVIRVKVEHFVLMMQDGETDQPHISKRLTSSNLEMFKGSGSFFQEENIKSF